ncbi:hypothetical protein CLCR_08906 [Cladophialophora carrionii]|uniref:Uncharacterized protein n=1 Tax=Cladophialophora carrionii TaxID=86049 RepID=A0A1C1CUG1_9EURO|nr:hypothetical protein CLCR_08906 [Cladophialophora carrionii]
MYEKAEAGEAGFQPPTQSPGALSSRNLEAVIIVRQSPPQDTLSRSYKAGLISLFSSHKGPQPQKMRLIKKFWCSADSLSQMSGRSLPLEEGKNWTPYFNVNALAVIALLGQSAVNRNLGRLVRSKWLAYLPLIGSITFASDAFADKQPRLPVYNIDHDIYTPDVAGWLTRWLMARIFRTASTRIEWEVNPEPMNSVFGRPELDSSHLRCLVALLHRLDRSYERWVGAGQRRVDDDIDLDAGPSLGPQQHLA